MCNRWFGKPRGTRALMLTASVLITLSGCAFQPFSYTQEAFDERRARWELNQLSDYDYVYRRSCECLPAATSAMTVAVRGGEVASATDTQSGATVAAYEYPTIDELFDLIQDAIDRDAERLDVTYDTWLDYPTQIRIDYDLETADDEFTIEARDLAPM